MKDKARSKRKSLLLDISDCNSKLNTSSPGRECTKCREFLAWKSFDRKSNGINGRDSRCKDCIAKVKVQKAKKRKQDKLRGQKITAKFKHECFGQLDSHSIDRFSSILCESVVGLIEDGRV